MGNTILMFNKIYLKCCICYFRKNVRSFKCYG